MTKAERRVVEALEELRAAARAAGIPDPDELSSPLSLRADAWLQRTRQLLPAAVDPFYPTGTEW